MFGRLVFYLLGMLALISPSVRAEGPTIEIQNAWIRAVPPGSAATAGYALIRNRGDEAVELTAAESGIAGEVRPMITTRKILNGQEVVGMEFVKTLTIPARSQRVLEPGGDHLMFLQLREIPRIGSEVSVTVRFGKQTLTLPFAVRKK